ncbi:hypothetical protein EIP91_007759 [Steccherinum ochraceum]|uniref:Uncharacterized protein n=1 Tax=Steccherinum ochraceum TaxID=92696 RepID=A0A4R0RQH1_9APHY|nr:hypothetical protein EIP91_007759 [Steccherinum ochraceum]
MNPKRTLVKLRTTSRFEFTDAATALLIIPKAVLRVSSNSSLSSRAAPSQKFSSWLLDMGRVGKPDEADQRSKVLKLSEVDYEYTTGKSAGRSTLVRFDDAAATHRRGGQYRRVLHVFDMRMGHTHRVTSQPASLVKRQWSDEYTGQGSGLIDTHWGSGNGGVVQYNGTTDSESSSPPQTGLSLPPGIAVISTK